MEICFHKYQGTGNDFIMIDNLNGAYDDLSIDQIIRLCDRRFGVGADGLILINFHSVHDFEVDYYNADGSKSFCGNGARCSVAFAETLGLNVTDVTFMAIDGAHKAYKKGAMVCLEMNDVSGIESDGEDKVLNTGSPHYVKEVVDLTSEDVVDFGRKVRYSDKYRKEGINVNLMQSKGSDKIGVLTYERGVEDETLSCGTGATACALVHGMSAGSIGENEVFVEVKGGELLVAFEKKTDGSFRKVTLTGPAEFVFSGKIVV
jgi:diaminopimelate epimerase